MRTMDRLYAIFSERKDAAIVKSDDRSFDPMHSFKAMYKRENCVLKDVISPGEINWAYI